MKKVIYNLILVGVCVCQSCDKKEIDTATPPSEYNELVWGDDFNATTLDATKWNKGIGVYFTDNGEQQFFTDRPENVFIKDGDLVIQVQKENYSGKAYTSGDLSTKGKFNFQDNFRIDIRAKMSKGFGLWNSFAFLPEEQKYGPYPKSGALTMEHLTRNPSDAIINVAYASTADRKMRTSVVKLDKGTFYEDYHTFSAIWGNGIVRWYYDDKEVMRVKQSDFTDAIYPFNEKFFLTIKTAVGGQIAGNPTAETQFPQQLLIDYIRVYRVPAAK